MSNLSRLVLDLRRLSPSFLDGRMIDEIYFLEMIPALYMWQRVVNQSSLQMPTISPYSPYFRHARLKPMSPMRPFNLLNSRDRYLWTDGVESVRFLSNQDISTHNVTDLFRDSTRNKDTVLLQ